MYFPYLYGRQAERSALITLAPELGTPQKVFPVVEPHSPARGLIRVLEKFRDHGAKAYVVVNPDRDVLAAPQAQAAWAAVMAPYLDDQSLVIPTLKITAATRAVDVRRFLDAHSGQHVGLVVDSTAIPPRDLATIVVGRNALTFLKPESNPVGYAAALGPAATVEIENSFPGQPRNADYPDGDWFSESHVTFASEGRLGFADFTVLPPTPPSTRGGPAGAVVVHLTWEDGPDDLRVQHFLSDERDTTQGTAGGKLLEALAHMAAQRAVTPTRFQISPGLAAFQDILDRRHSTSLGKSKEHQIAHHIFTVARTIGA